MCIRDRFSIYHEILYIMNIDIVKLFRILQIYTILEFLITILYSDNLLNYNFSELTFYSNTYFNL